jgi:hypothetical protein
MARIKRSEIPLEYYRVKESELATKEKNDCTVVAVALVCKVSYEAAFAALKAEGRVDGHGASISKIGRAINKLGKHADMLTETNLRVEFISKYPGCHSTLKSATSHHPARFPKAWKNGRTYLAWSRYHAFAIIDGVTHDWSANRSLRIEGMFEIND